MSLPELLREAASRSAVEKLSKTIQGQELAVAEDAARQWALAEKARTRIDARSELVRHAFTEGARTYAETMAAAHGDAVLELLALGYVEAQNQANRSDVRKV